MRQRYSNKVKRQAEVMFALSRNIFFCEITAFSKEPSHRDTKQQKRKSRQDH